MISNSKNPCLGMSGLHPWGIEETHKLLREINGLYTVPYIDYHIWYNGKENLKPEDAPAFYDKVISLNSEYRQILRFSPIPDDKRAEFVKMIIERYPNVWGVAPVSEIASAEEAAKTIKSFREILPDIRLVGPHYPTSYNVEYMDTLLKLGAIQCLDVIAMHDYYACPGRGTIPPPPWDGMPYAHPNEAMDYFPNMFNRINWLKEKYVPFLRPNFNDGIKIIYAEYGLYSGNVNDAKLAALVSRYTGVPLILSSPQGPMGSYPYCHAIYTKQEDGSVTGKWNDAVNMLLETMELPIEKVVEVIHSAIDTPKKKRVWWKQIFYKLFGWFK